MSLDVCLVETRPTRIFDYNITHNLGKMAVACGLYQYLWRPEETEVKKASDLIPHLQGGLKLLLDAPDYYKQFNSPNGWGMYEHFVKFVQSYLDACIESPDATIEVSR